MKKCPVCNSTRISKNEKGDKRCQACGWIHHEGKQEIVFVNHKLKEV